MHPQPNSFQLAINFNNIISFMKQERVQTQSTIREDTPESGIFISFTDREKQSLYFFLIYERQSQANILKSRINNVQIFLMVGWMINFYLAAADKSPGMNFMLPHFPVNFRMWNWIDGGLNMMTLFAFLFLKMTVQRYHIGNMNELLKKGFKKTFIMVVGFLILKSGWIIIGMVIFLSFNINQTSSELMNFVTIYFVGFLGGIIYIFWYLIWRRLSRKNETRFQNKFGVKITDILAEFQKNQRDCPEAKKFVRTFLQRVAHEISSRSVAFWFFWVVNLILYFKDNSPCMDAEIIGSWTYRNWHLIQMITILSIVPLSMVTWNYKLKIKLKIDFHCIPLYIICKILMGIFMIAQLALGVIGMLMFFRLNRKTCSSQVVQFSIGYFIGIITIISYFLFSMVELLFLKII